MANINESTLKMFNAIPIQQHWKKSIYNKQNTYKILSKTIPYGFIFSDEVLSQYQEKELNDLIELVKKEIGITSSQLNNSFHKSWKKVRDADIERLVIEQIAHYITTYGFERLGIYDSKSVFIPIEEQDIPDNGIELLIIHGYTKEELKEKTLNLFSSGVALKEDTIKYAVNVALFVDITTDEIEKVNNKEAKVVLYDFLGKVPKDPVEFLRYVVYKATDSTLLIKNRETIETIKQRQNIDIIKLFHKYNTIYGLEKLAETFYRFKPIFLAFKTNPSLNTIINKIRKLAVKHHKPMQEDYLNIVTTLIKRGNFIDKEELEEKLEEVNIFRKIRLAYALKFRTTDADSILYKIRNGKSFAKKLEYTLKSIEKQEAEHTLNYVLDSITKDIHKNVSGKKIYIPENIFYALPSTEKQFTGNIPSGTCIKTEKDMIIGVHWENQKNTRIDLDLALTNIEGKFGWDGDYRAQSLLFSGDMTDAPPPKGASELFYINHNSSSFYTVSLNYYNYADIEVPFDMFVAKEQIANMEQNYTVNPENIIGITQSSISGSSHQKTLGLLLVEKDSCNFYFSETAIGRGITFGSQEYHNWARNYMYYYFKNIIFLNEILEKAGAVFVDEEDCEINLSMRNLDKNTILDLLVDK